MNLRIMLELKQFLRKYRLANAGYAERFQSSEQEPKETYVFLDTIRL